LAGLRYGGLKRGEVEMGGCDCVISGNEIARTSGYEGARCSVPVEVNYVRE
jgi:hypothetical protein